MPGTQTFFILPVSCDSAENLKILSEEACDLMTQKFELRTTTELQHTPLDAFSQLRFVILTIFFKKFVILS